MPTDKHAGKKLSELRESQFLTMLAVYELSKAIAAARHNRAFLIPPPRLSDIETKGVVPNIYRLYTLSFAYEINLEKLLGFYGLEFRGWKE
jgi:hypothetical protein